MVFCPPPKQKKKKVSLRQISCVNGLEIKLIFCIVLRKENMDLLQNTIQIKPFSISQVKYLKIKNKFACMHAQAKLLAFNNYNRNIMALVHICNDKKLICNLIFFQ